MYLLEKIFNPEIYQGKYKKKNYFEGWYYKIIDHKLEHAYAIIPGVAFGKENEDAHAFIQVLDANTSWSHYFKYDITSFHFNEKKFEVVIADNYFSSKKMCLNLSDDVLSIQGELSFQNIIEYPKTRIRPGIMGPYSFVPFMECYHCIVNIQHEIYGELMIGGKEIDFSKGYGYLEKDWGRSFPEAWIWFQSNHFNEDDVTLMFSVAKIPWLGRTFTGFLSFIRRKDKLYVFSTYTKAKITSLKYNNDKLRITIQDKQYRMEISVVNSKGGVLKAPKNGLMKREIVESIHAKVKVRLYDRKGNMVYTGDGINTGLEIINWESLMNL